MTDTLAGASPVERRVEPQWAMPPVWRLKGRANPFCQWVVVEHCHRLEDACARAVLVKRQYQFYAVHIRAN
jgi:hypothetical protein